MSRPNKYQAQASLGIAGLFLIATPLFIKLPSQFSAFNSSTELETELAKEKAQVEASENLERARTCFAYNIFTMAAGEIGYTIRKQANRK